MPDEAILAPCRALLARGADLEEVLALLRERGVSKVGSMLALWQLLRMPLDESKALVHHSRVWRDIYARDDAFLEQLYRAVDQLDEGDESVGEAGG